MNETSVKNLDFGDMQGLIASAYSHLPCSSYILLQIEKSDLARAWLASLIPCVTTSAAKHEEFSLNIAFTSSGLKSLGLEQGVHDCFSFAFQEGMTTQHRSRILGDVEENCPQKWCWGAVDHHSVDILLLVYARTEDGLSHKVNSLRSAFSASGIKKLRILEAGRSKNREHFGFMDGISQPVLEGGGPFERIYQKVRQRSGDVRRVKPGEFIIGYADESGHVAPLATLMVDGTMQNAARAADFGRNGSYLVFRHLAQDVAAFRKFLDQSTLDPDGEPDPTRAEILAAKMVGRWREGGPLVSVNFANRHSRSQANAFQYAENDPDGFKCPLGAHIRRANPRDTLDLADPTGAFNRVQRRRLLRRGRSFGPRLLDDQPEDGLERGLYFICLCADLERQFEFVQQTWINNPAFSTLSEEVDPLIGSRFAGNSFTIPKDPVPARICNLKQFVTVRGGGYFFLPGIRALRTLAGSTP